MLNSVLSSASCRAYHRSWGLFTKFYQRFFKTNSIHLPLSSATMALFISYLDARKLAPSTITSYFLAISYVHKMKGIVDPTKTFLVKKLLTAVYRRKPSDVRLPISKVALHDIVESLNHTNIFGSTTCCFLCHVSNGIL